MNLQDIKDTPIWTLYEKGRNFHRMKGIYTDTDRNYRFYNGNQWEGANLGDVEPVQINFIKPIVKYKLSTIHSNLFAINYASQNYDSKEFHKTAEKCCQLLNHYASRIWERDKMDFKGRKVTKDAAINGEGIIYVYFDRETMFPVNENIKKNDIYYGNENNDDIQSQPYIIIRRRMSVIEAVEYALSEGVEESQTELIIGDNDTFEESGDDAKLEVDDMVTVLYKMYKKDGTVHFSASTRHLTITEDNDTGLSLYPVAHFNWEEKEGCARGEGEVKNLIPNQIEVNKNEVRRVLTVKYQAFPQKIADTSKITNPEELNTSGSTIEIYGQTVDDVRKVIGTLPPAQLSPDVKQLRDDLIQTSRDLAGAGDIATGQINPETASGRAILAVQQASAAPMTEQRESYKNFIEDLAKIWLDFLIVNSDNGVNMEDKVVNPQNGEETVTIVTIHPAIFQRLQTSVKIDVTPRSVYDKFAQEQAIENLLVQGFLTPQRVNELEIYANLLDDDSVMPKAKLLEAIKLIRENQKRIAEMEANAQMLMQRANQFVSEDLDSQASQLANAQHQMLMQNSLQA